MVERLIMNDVWSPVSRHWFYKGELSDITVYEDGVGEIQIAQHTNKRMVWTKEQRRNHENGIGWFNYTRLCRKEAPLKKKGDC